MKSVPITTKSVSVSEKSLSG